MVPDSALRSTDERSRHDDLLHRSQNMTAPAVLDVLEDIVQGIVEPAAAEVDREGTFPRAAVTALGEAGLLGLLSSTALGGRGGTLADAAQVVRRLAAACGSTAMVVCMHYCATAVIERHGSDE